MFSIFYNCINSLPEIFFLLLWIGLQIFLFITSIHAIKTNSALESTSALLGSSFWVAKASAVIINFNAAVLVLTMCQVTITVLRGTVLSHFVPFDKATDLHRLASYSLVFFAIIHSITHYVNFSKIPTLWSNLAFLSGPGATGHILWLFLLLIWITSIITIIRKMRYEIFWYIHQLSVVFFILMSVHGGAFCFIKRDFGVECLGSKTWTWLIGPSSLKLFELFYIQYRVRKFTFISKVIVHQSNVIELQIKKPSFRYIPGQFLRINCPQIATCQWHPFTITSAPEENFVSIHLSIVGDWTRAMAGLLGCEFKQFHDIGHESVESISDCTELRQRNGRKSTPNHTQRHQLSEPRNENVICNYSPPTSLPKVFIDGPYGSVNENFDQFEVVICVGAGIGQTPFASILKSMWYSITHPYQSMKLHKIIYYGISREIQSLSWFIDILKAIEAEDSQNLLEINCHLTGKISNSQALFLHLTNQKFIADPITGLKSKTIYGRPNFDLLFSKWSERFKNITGKIGIFYCGPKVLGQKLKVLSIKKRENNGNDNNKKKGVKFIFHQETF